MTLVQFFFVMAALAFIGYMLLIIYGVLCRIDMKVGRR